MCAERIPCQHTLAAGFEHMPLRCATIMPIVDADITPCSSGETPDVCEYDNSSGTIELIADGKRIHLVRRSSVRVPTFLFANSDWCITAEPNATYKINADARRTLLQLDVELVYVFKNVRAGEAGEKDKAGDAGEVIISRGFIHILPTIESVTHGELSGLTPTDMEKLKCIYGMHFQYEFELIVYLMDRYFVKSPTFKLIGTPGWSTLNYRPKLLNTEELRTTTTEQIIAENARTLNVFCYKIDNQSTI